MRMNPFAVLAMWRRAHRHGISFRRTKSWHPPEEIAIGGRHVEVAFPDDVGCRSAFRDIFLHDCYGLEKAAPSDTATVLDIGANAGFFSLFARGRFPAARIHAYEPNPELRDVLAMNARAGKFTCFCKSVGLAAGTTRLVRNPETCVSNMVVPDADGEIVQVPFSTCLERLGGRAAIVKMDCEGAEWEILKDRDSWRNVRFVAMEVHRNRAHAESECKDMLRDMGFHLLAPSLRGRGHHLVWAEREGRGNARRVTRLRPRDELGTHASAHETEAPICT